MTEQDPPSDLDLELSAYLDGELDEHRARVLEERLAADPHLAQRLAALMGGQAEFTRALDALDDEPMPDSVLALLAERETPPGNVVSLQPRTRRLAPLALAAGIALVVGFVAARLVAPVPGQAAPDTLLAAGTIQAGSPLYAVLQNQPSGTVTNLPGGTAATPIMSFADTAGAYCRELQVRSADTTGRALACIRNGAWQVQVAEFAPAHTTGYQVAGDASAVARVAGSRMQGEPLSASAEAALLGRW